MRWRIVAGVAALPLWGWALFFTGLDLLSIAILTEPFLPDGDPCCKGHPQSWDDVRDAIPSLVNFTALNGLFFAAALWVTAFAVFGRVPRARWLVLPPLACVLTALTMVTLALYPTRDDPRWDPVEPTVQSPPVIRRTVPVQ